MKKIIKFSALALALCMTVMMLAACGGAASSSSASGDASSQAAETTVAATEAAKEADYSNPDLTIADGDYAAMESFLNDWSEQKWDGKVIKISGKSARRMSNCTILEENGKGTGKGCSYEIIGGSFPDDYPADDAKVTLTGVLYYNPETFARVLQVPKDQIAAQ